MSQRSSDSDAGFVIEDRVARALERTIDFKRLSGEPWRTVRDSGDLRIAARHFANISKQLQWADLDALGL